MQQSSHGLLPETESVLLLQMQQMDDAADEQFGNDVASAIVDWVAQRMSDYHKNFHDTSLMQARVLARGLTRRAAFMPSLDLLACAPCQLNMISGYGTS